MLVVSVNQACGAFLIVIALLAAINVIVVCSHLIIKQVDSHRGSPVSGASLMLIYGPLHQS